MVKNAGNPSHIVVAVDGSKNAQKAGEMAIRLAEDAEASLFVVAVTQVGGNESAFDAVSRAEEGELDGQMGSASQGIKLNLVRNAVDQVVSTAKKHGVNAKGELILAEGSVVEAILDYQVKNKGDLIVVGTRGRGGFRRLLMGSVSTGVVNHANCSVLVVR